MSFQPAKLVKYITKHQSNSAGAVASPKKMAAIAAASAPNITPAACSDGQRECVPTAANKPSNVAKRYMNLSSKEQSEKSPYLSVAPLLFIRQLTIINQSDKLVDMNTTSNVIGAFEAKTYLSEILEKVQAGQSFTITKRGKAVAEIKPIHSSKLEQGLAALEKARRIRASVKGVFTREEIKALIHEGHKY